MQASADGIIRLDDPAHVRLINDLQWEAAYAVLLASPDTPEGELHSRASYWLQHRSGERTIFREEIVDQTETEVRTRQGSGQAPSGVSLDLPFIVPLLPAPASLGRYAIPPVRDPARVERVDRAFEKLDDWDLQRRAQ